MSGIKDRQADLNFICQRTNTVDADKAKLSIISFTSLLLSTPLSLSHTHIQLSHPFLLLLLLPKIPRLDLSCLLISTPIHTAFASCPLHFHSFILNPLVRAFLLRLASLRSLCQINPQTRNPLFHSKPPSPPIPTPLKHSTRSCLCCCPQPQLYIHPINLCKVSLLFFFLNSNSTPHNEQHQDQESQDRRTGRLHNSGLQSCLAWCLCLPPAKKV